MNKPKLWTLTLYITLYISGAANAGGITFEFNDDGINPSEQGATYYGNGNFWEYEVFTASGGILTLNTLQYLPQDAFAYYDIPNIVDHSCDLILEWDAKIWSNVQVGLIGTAVQIADGAYSWTFYLQTNGMQYASAGPTIYIANLDTTDTFHTYKMTSPADSSSFNFYVDGVLTYSGNGSSGATTNFLRFGDFYTTFGSTLAWWDRMSLYNTATNPEPGDINGDCKVDLGDLILLERQVLGF